MNFLTLIWLFVLGTIFWSFWSVLLQRIQHKLNWKTIKWFLVGRSECPQCHHILAWYDLIPLYSWLSTRGKCRYCGVHISTMYPVLEIVSGIVFVLRWWWGVSDELWGMGIFFLVIRWLLWLLLVWDMYTYELHVPVWFIALMSVIVHLIWSIATGGEWWVGLLYGGVFLAVFLGIYYFARWYTYRRYRQKADGFWQGDVMLAPILGYMIGISGLFVSDLTSHWMMSLTLVMSLLVIASILGIIYHGIVRLTHHFAPKTDLPDQRHSTGAVMIPFLPAMIVAYWIVTIVGQL